MTGATARPGRGSTLGAAIAVLAVWGAGGVARAQTCTATDPTTTVCRAVLSAPRAFTVRGSVQVPDHQPAPTRMTVILNGRPCGSGRLGMFSGRSVACHADLPAGETVVEVRTDSPAIGAVAFIPNRSLSALPREVRDLEPNGRPLPFWARYWPY